jgi:NADPH:quinone reductase-like Zn-dependent oxidoreductase
MLARGVERLAAAKQGGPYARRSPSNSNSVTWAITCAMTSSGKKLSLVLDSLGGSPVGELARSLKPGGSIAVYAFKLGLPVLSPEFLYNNLNLHGFWIGNWMRNAPSTEIQELYQKLADLVADGSLSAAVEQVYPLDQFKQAIDRSLKSSRYGKILFKFDAG